MKSIKGFALIAGCLALAALATVSAVPPIAAIGFALAGLIAAFAPEPFRPCPRTPRSIFETRRQGLA